MGGGVVALENVAEQLGGPAGLLLVLRLELPACQLDQLGDERPVLGEPALALDLGPLAIAGVGQEVAPAGGEAHAAVGVGLGGEHAADLPVLVGDERLDLPLA